MWLLILERTIGIKFVNENGIFISIISIYVWNRGTVGINAKLY